MRAARDAPDRLARGPAAATALVAAAVFVALAVVLVPWDWVPGGSLHPVAASDLFTTREIARAERFSSLQRYASWSSYFLSLVVALVLGLTPWGARLVRRVGGRLPWWLAVVVGALVLLVIGRVVTLPFALWSRQLDYDYGLTNQGLAGWAVDDAKSLLVGWVITSILLLIVVAIARRSPRYWFAWAGGLAFVLVFGGSFLYPVLVEPLFNNFTPMHAGAFKQSVFRLAREEGVHISDVLVADASRRTTTINAYVSGLGGTRRVVVYDTLMKDLSPNEARVVIAHELAHAKNRDVLLGTGLGAVGSVFGIAVLALLLDSDPLRRRAGGVWPGDPAVIALVLALSALGGFLVSPVENTVSRAIEARADRVSIEATGEGAVFVRMQRQLAVRSLADPTPPWFSQFWFGSHPTVLQRAGLPRSLQEAHR